jgi:hypothetical protein
MLKAERLLHTDWDLYDTRHTVYRPAQMTPQMLEKGYRRAYREFYRWGSILRGASRKPDFIASMRHIGYAGGWKKFEPLWDWVIRARRISNMLPVLEGVLTGFGKHPSSNITPEDLPTGSASNRSMRAPETELLKTV